MRKTQMRLGSLVLAIVLLLNVFPVTIQAAGDEWIEISDAAGLLSIGDNLSGNYRLTADIDLGGAEWDPLGSFTGTFDGNSKVIRNFTINDTTAAIQGLFSEIGAGGTVRRLGIEKANITAGNSAGILAGINHGTVELCYVKGDISGNETVGGLIGFNYGEVINSFASAFISAKDNVGGLVGSNSGTIDGSYSSSEISPSVFNNYLVFDGDDYITIPHRESYNTGTFTLEAWFQWDKVDQAPAGDGTNIVEFIISKGVEQFEIHTGWGKNGIRFIPVTRIGSGDSYLDVKNVIQPGWFHVAAVYDFANDSARVYVNGVAQDIYINLSDSTVGTTASLPRDTNPLAGNTNTFNIGRRTDASYPFHGKICDVRFWNIARTAEQINADKGKQLSGEEDGLVGYWKLNDIDMKNGIAPDSTAANNSGTLHGTFGIAAEDPASTKGGLVGDNTGGTVTNCYYDSENSGQLDNDGKGVPKIKADMQLQSTYTDWDFTSIWVLDSHFNSGYPYLLPVISAVDLIMTAPAAGAIPQTAEQVEAATGCEDFTVSVVEWNEELTSKGKFRADQVYTSNVTLISKNGKMFKPEALTPVVTGSASVGTTATDGTGVGNTVTFVVTFPATEAKTVTGMQIKNQPLNCIYTEGDNLNLAGLEVTLTYNDSSTEDVAADAFADKGITASPADSTVLTVADHNGSPVTLTYNGYDATTNNITVNADTRTITGYYTDNSGSDTALTTAVTVPYGTTEAAAKAGLTSSGYAKLSDNSYVAVTISWAFDEAYNGSDTGAKAVTGTVIGTFPGDQLPANRTGTVTVEAALTYKISAISDQTMTAKTVGYGSGTQETKNITVTRTGTGDLTNLAVSLSGGGSSSFIVTQPMVTTLNAGIPSTTFTVKAKDGLSVGTYTDTVTVTSEELTAGVSFNVAQVIMPADTQATPSFSPAGGAIAFGSAVTIMSEGADHIYYTTDGTVPATSAGGSTTEYTVPITVNSAMTIKAIAVKAGNIESAIGSASYTQDASADLTGLVLSGSPSNFAFAESTYTYDEVTVASEVESIMVTPTGEGTITVDGTVVNSGEASEAIELMMGVEKTITVVAAETGKTPKTYTIKVTREILNIPGAPVLSAPVSGDGYVSLTWSAVDGSTGYNVYARTSSDTYSTPAVTVAEAVYGCDVTDLTNGTTYYFVVRAAKTVGESNNSNEVSAIPKTVPGAPANIKATAGNRQASVSFTAPYDNGGSTITGYTVTSNPGNMSAFGTAGPITVTGLTNGTSYTFTVTAINEAGISAPSVVSNTVIPYTPANERDDDDEGTAMIRPRPTTQPPANTGIDILINGKAESAGNAADSKQGNQTVTTITIDPVRLEHKLESEGPKAIVTISFSTNADIVVGELNGQMVKNMETKEAVLEIKTGNVTYTLPASQINIDNISEQIGKQVELKDIKVKVVISGSSQNTMNIVENTANKNNYQVVVKPIDFNITCSNGNKTVEVTKFDGYVERRVAIPDGIDPSKITTGIVLNSDGTFSHVPTAIAIIGSKYYAKINSLTNSTYSIIWSPKTFEDVEKHWAMDAANDMGSRLVISGVENGKFEPDRDITRGEFAAIVVRALGLMRPGTGRAAYNDISENGLYYDAISIAYENGLISGYGSSKFGLNDMITREQAITIIAKAMRLTKLNVDFKEGEAEQLLAAYDDSGKASSWAKEAISSCIKTGIVSGRNVKLVAPKDYMTRAEAATIIQRLLQKSNLI